MDRQTLFGIILGLLGIALGAAAGAYLMLHPEAASLVLTLSLWSALGLVLAGVAVAMWPRKKATPQPPSVAITSHSQSGGITAQNVER